MTIPKGKTAELYRQAGRFAGRGSKACDNALQGLYRIMGACAMICEIAGCSFDKEFTMKKQEITP
ncbi:hypothetical protein ACMDCR_06570 [Labrys okinawensis]|uniref:hypothetical protein n=1 Tax=Labrys okinawensis TaxID=346911 RepID=UPI0039BD1DEA